MLCSCFASSADQRNQYMPPIEARSTAGQAAPSHAYYLPTSRSTETLAQASRSRAPASSAQSASAGLRSWFAQCLAPFWPRSLARMKTTRYLDDASVDVRLPDALGQGLLQLVLLQE